MEHWIFGYGSLLWRPDFAHRERRPARLEGYTRRFWQGSTDHRGVPGAPGRVVTLVPEAGACCWGVAYRLAPESAAAVIEGLDHRERGGYARRSVGLGLREPEGHVSGLVYFAEPDNPNYLGPASLAEIAEQVRSARGPSGPNREYVLRLAAGLRALAAPDPHVFALEALLGAGEGAGRG